MYTKEFIKEKLSTDLRWIERGLIVLYNRQTTDEQQSKNTKHLNGRGFNSVDSSFLTYCSEYILKGNHLSGKYLERVKKRLPRYWNQIREEIQMNENRG